MKISTFKSMLRSDIEQICETNAWDKNNAKQRGMAFENWCFNLLKERLPHADYEAEESILRTDDFEIDICLPSPETEEVFILQCKHYKLAQNPPIKDDDIKSFFATFDLLTDKKLLKNRGTKNSKLIEIANGVLDWQKESYQIHMVFASTGKSTDSSRAVTTSFNKKYNNVSFEVWDIDGICDQYTSNSQMEERYPDEVSIVLKEGSFLYQDQPLKNLTFTVPGTTLQQLYRNHRDSLFNWNIRTFLGKKGLVNKGMADTIANEPENFYYFNNGISALCESFKFDKCSRNLSIQKLQIVNGAQTVGAIRSAIQEDAQKINVLVKLTAVKGAARERGVAASLIKTNNTQNALRVPDFRANDAIQLWLETQFKNTKPRGNLGKLVYARRRPWPRAKTAETLVKMVDLGKIIYSWYHDPRIAISAPNRLFLHKNEKGLYEDAFGHLGDEVPKWPDEDFDEALLAIHTYHKIILSLKDTENRDKEFSQISRLKLGII